MNKYSSKHKTFWKNFVFFLVVSPQMSHRLFSNDSTFITPYCSSTSQLSSPMHSTFLLILICLFPRHIYTCSSSSLIRTLLVLFLLDRSHKSVASPVYAHSVNTTVQMGTFSGNHTCNS